jgi:septal ring factor EnvC (AmiA/AmiB activator)
MSDETTRIDKPARSTKEHATLASVFLAIVMGGGGIYTGTGLNTRLEQVAVTLAEIKGSITRQDEGRARLEQRLDRLEDRIHTMETGRKQ